MLKVNDLSNSPQGFDQTNDIATGDVDANNEDHTEDYTYDFNGNMKTDTNKGIEGITYNHLNLPTKILFSGTTNGNILYIYNAIGGKVKKVVEDNVAHSTTTTDYLSGFQYKNAELQFFPHAEGYVHYTKPLAAQGGVNSELGSFNYVFNYTDHLGNVRLSYAKDPLVGNRVKILEENHYYAFGLKHKNYNVERLDFDQFPETGVELVPMPAVANASYNYKYNGKELQEELGLNWLDYGWRNYDPSIGRFNRLDRFSEKYFDKTTYGYAANNPVYYVDVAGDSLYIKHKNVDLLYDNGKLYNKDGSDYKGKVKGFLKKVVNALGEISKSNEGQDMINELQSSSNTFVIENGASRFSPSDANKAYSEQLKSDPTWANAYSYIKNSGKSIEGGSGGTIFWKPTGTDLPTTKGYRNDTSIVLGHEMFHGLDSNRGFLDSRVINGLEKSEWQAVYRENNLRAQLQLPLRTHYFSNIDQYGVKSATGAKMLDSSNNNVKPTWYK